MNMTAYKIYSILKYLLHIVMKNGENVKNKHFKRVLECIQLVSSLTVNGKETLRLPPVFSPLLEQIETNNQPHTPDWAMYNLSKHSCSSQLNTNKYTWSIINHLQSLIYLSIRNEHSAKANPNSWWVCAHPNGGRWALSSTPFCGSGHTPGIWCLPCESRHKQHKGGGKFLSVLLKFHGNGHDADAGQTESLVLIFAVWKYDRSAILPDGPQPADPACRSSACLLDIIFVVMLTHPVVDIDRQGVVE